MEETGCLRDAGEHDALKASEKFNSQDVSIFDVTALVRIARKLQIRNLDFFFFALQILNCQASNLEGNVQASFSIVSNNNNNKKAFGVTVTL